jgi:Zn-finger nucleic acid-binding protein
VTAYRTAGSNACPDCSVPLRPYGARLICDDCTGMLIGVDDLRRAVAEMGGGRLELPLVSTETGAPCPTCARRMDRFRLEVTEHPTAFRGRYLSMLATNLVRAEAIDQDTTFPGCPAHGMWFGQGLLAGVFARINAKLSVGRGGARSVAERGLRISQRKVKPRSVVPYLSPNAGRTLRCPSCYDPLIQRGDHWSCERCAGVFVEPEALEQMIAEMRNAPYELPAAAGPVGDQHCPVCDRPARAETLEGRPVGRCASHGVWFAGGELSAVLAHAAPITRPSWLRRLFRRRS